MKEDYFSNNNSSSHSSHSSNSNHSSTCSNKIVDYQQIRFEILLINNLKLIFLKIIKYYMMQEYYCICKFFTDLYLIQ